MDRGQIGECFDKAYASMYRGDFASASRWFEQIILHSADPYASGLAKQRLRWYCLPIQAISEKLEESGRPRELHALVVEAVGDVELEEVELQNLVREIAEILEHMPGFVRVGKALWVARDAFERCVARSAQRIAGTREPIALARLLRDYWPGTAIQHEFPDEMARTALSIALTNLGIHVVDSEHALSDSVARTVCGEATRRLRSSLRLDVDHLLADVWPSAMADAAESVGLVAFVERQLATQTVRVTPGTLASKEIFDLRPPDLDVLFSSLIPRTADELMTARLGGEALIGSELTADFRHQARAALARQGSLVALENEYWISQTAVKALADIAAGVLNDRQTPLRLQDVVATQLLGSSSVTWPWLAPLVAAVESHLHLRADIVAVGRQYWLHRSALQAVVSDLYNWLVTQGHPRPMNALLEYATAKEGLAIPYVSGLSGVLEQALRSDNRFIQPPFTRDWMARQSAESNPRALVIAILAAHHRPIAFVRLAELMRERHNISISDLDLASDTSFRRWDAERWALADWVSINDAAYEYLEGNEIPLHAITIAGSTCERLGLPPARGIFTPEEDARFIQVAHNRWTCKRMLSQVEVDRLLAYLVQAGGQGVTLEQLLSQVLRVEPRVTDVVEKLAADNRFVCVAGRWYARGATFYELESRDVDALCERLASLPDDRLPEPLRVLVDEVLGRDYRLTDAEEIMRGDPRLLEVHPGYWAPAGYSAPFSERSPASKVTVRGRREEGLGQTGDAEVPAELTLRRRRSPADAPPAVGDAVTVTLSHLDIRHGNIRLGGELGGWIAAGARTVRLLDEMGDDFVGHVDPTHSLLNISAWLRRRMLTYGDRIVVQRTADKDLLIIRPKGERDERVYQEALSHMDIERLIEEARRVNKTYHDLMIEVLEAVGGPVHREDIFQLVDYRRTASRNYIATLLSLPDCPYEELRYFVPHGRGFWSFDPERKKALDMKIMQLVEENNTLRGQVSDLQARTVQQSGRLGLLEQSQQQAVGEQARLQERLKELQGELVSAQNESTTRATEVAELQAEKTSLLHTLQQAEASVKQQRTRVDSLTRELAAELASAHQLRQALDRVQVEKRAGDDELAALQARSAAERHRIAELETTCLGLEAKMEGHRQRASELAALNAKLEMRVGAVESARAEWISERAVLSEQVSALQSEIDAFEQERADWTAERSALLEGSAALRKQLDALAQERADLTIARSAQLERVGALQEQLGQLEVMRKAWATERGELEAQITNLAAVRAAVENRLEAIQADGRRSVAELEGRIAILEADTAGSAERQESLETALAAANRDKAELLRTRNDLASRLERMIHDQQVSQSECEACVEEVTLLRQAKENAERLHLELTATHQELATLEGELATAQAALAMAQAEVEQAPQTLAVQDAELVRLRSRLAQIEKALNSRVGKVAARLLRLS